MALQIRLTKSNAEIIQLYLSMDSKDMKDVKDISDDRIEILSKLKPVLEDKVETIVLDEQLFNLIDGLFSYEYEGSFIEEFGSNFEKFDILQRKMKYAKNAFKRIKI